MKLRQDTLIHTHEWKDESMRCLQHLQRSAIVDPKKHTHRWDTEMFCLDYLEWKCVCPPWVDQTIHALSFLHMCKSCTCVIAKSKLKFRVISFRVCDCHLGNNCNYWKTPNIMDIIKKSII